MTFRAASTAGNGATASSATLTVPIPGSAVAGDAAIIVAGSNYNGTTLTTPSGWTLLSGPDDATAGNRGYMFGKILTSGDISSGSVTLTYSAAARAVAICAVFDVGGESAPFGTPAHTSTTTTASSVTTTRASSDVALFHLQGFAGDGQAPACTFTQGNDVSARGNLATGANMGLTSAHVAATATGSYGGGAISGASIATNYTSQVWGIELKRSSTPAPTLVATRPAANLVDLRGSTPGDGSSLTYPTPTKVSGPTLTVTALAPGLWLFSQDEDTASVYTVSVKQGDNQTSSTNQTIAKQATGSNVAAPLRPTATPPTTSWG